MPSDDSLLIPPVVATAARPTQEEIDAYNKENPDQDVMAYGNIVKSGSPSGSIAPTQEEYRNVHGAQIPIDPETDGVLYPITHGLAPMLYGAAKGTVAGTLGIPGDLNELLRKYVVPYEPTIVQDILHNMPDVFPTSEDVSKVVPSITQALDMDKTAQGSEEYGDFAGKNVVTGLEGPKLLGKVAGKAIEATKDLPVGLSIKDVSPSAPEGNLNFTPRITESHFTGPDEQPIQDLLAKAKQIPGVTKEGLANATESLRTYDPKTKMSKAEFVSHITPSKYSKELLTEPGPTAREEDYMMQGARDNVDRRDVIEDMGVPRGAMLNELTDLYDGDIAWNDLDPATKRHLSEIGIHDLNAFHEHFYDAEHELVMNWYNDIAHDHGFQNQGDYRYTGQQRVVPTAHPDYGKGLVKRHLGLESTYYSFDKAGWHFIFLDSLERDFGSKHGYTARIDDKQYAWLEKDLQSVAPSTPICVLSHVPLLSVCTFFDGFDDLESTGSWVIPGAWTHIDAKRIKNLFAKHSNVKFCMSGHVHLCDDITYLGVRYCCNGAVSGGWWKGPYQEFGPAYALVDFFEDGSVENKLVYYRS